MEAPWQYVSTQTMYASHFYFPELVSFNVSIFSSDLRKLWISRDPGESADLFLSVQTECSSIISSLRRNVAHVVQAAYINSTSVPGFLPGFLSRYHTK
jgi:hypothetical protein